MAAIPAADGAPAATGPDGADVTMTDAPPQPAGKKARKTREVFSCTLNRPAFAYAELELAAWGAGAGGAAALDELQVRAHLSAALTSFLGVTGAAVAVDVLKVEGRRFWVRVPRDDLAPFAAAAAAWPGADEDGAHAVLRVCAAGDWLGSLVGRGTQRKLWDA